MYVYSEKKLIEIYSKPAKMSRLSMFMLKRINFEEIIRKRRENYNFLLKKLKYNKNVKIIFPKITNEVTPIGFPIAIKKRKKIITNLIRNKIYPPIHWNLPKEIDKNEFSASWNISKNILTLPIDQRYEKMDMERMIKCLK